ncbi:hypothetical protein [Salinivibrio kushneri]|uniref:Phage tail protein n=1 Tax=Salinivibrio kushneri TaxID=1908198 RepID=A0AB36K950_9GAMM|nr:hypothetical protein [Salinivibrio kushneri]OOE45131.1 hypothetical protein BZG09_05350 [Salinivibrio kushneri]
MPYASEMIVSYKDIERGVPISDEEYDRAREHLINGGMVKVHGGKMILTSKPEKLDGHLDPVWQNGEWYHEPETEPTPEELAQQHAREENYWVKAELENVEVQLMLHWTSDPRAKATADAWSQYAQQLRNYTSTDEDGNPYIRDGETRPISPLDAEAAE